jgi:hypothetical protein
VAADVLALIVTWFDRNVVSTYMFDVVTSLRPTTDSRINFQTDECEQVKLLDENKVPVSLYR